MARKLVLERICFDSTITDFQIGRQKLDIISLWKSYIPRHFLSTCLKNSCCQVQIYFSRTNLWAKNYSQLSSKFHHWGQASHGTGTACEGKISVNNKSSQVLTWWKNCKLLGPLENCFGKGLFEQTFRWHGIYSTIYAMWYSNFSTTYQW